MRPTREYVIERFNEFNTLCFEGKLPLVEVRITNAKSYLGKVVYKREDRFLRGAKYSDFKILISNRRDLDQDVVDDTILHEMIHYWILYNGIKDSSAHGPVFRRMMHDFNRRFGRKMTVSHRVTEKEAEANKERKTNLVCVSRLVDGRYGVTVAARTRIFQLWDGLEAWDLVAECHWIFTDHPFFARFPRSKTTKLYHVKEEDLRSALESARLLHRDGSTIRITPHPFHLP